MIHARDDYPTKMGDEVLAAAQILVTRLEKKCTDGKHMPETLTAEESILVKAFNEYKAVRIPEAEPVFVLRAQDPHAAEAVRHYAEQVNRDAGADSRIPGMCMVWARRMDDWPSKTGKPDLPGARTGSVGGQPLGTLA
jgi:hypothetical protein